MDLKNLSFDIQQISDRIEDIFVDFSKEFPKLLNSTKSSSFDELTGALETLKTENSLSSKTESSFFNNYGEKYSFLFEALNKEIENLTDIDNQITNITNDSEEMELIALNAMVVSIKSGEKGRAFSCITENLQRLSTDMIKLSGKLTYEENILLDNINNLKNIFYQITETQKKIAHISNTQQNRVQKCIENSANPLNEIFHLSQSVYPAIQGAMEGLQLQDIIKQAFNHVTMSLDEFVDDKKITDISQKLDTIAFNLSLAELAQSVLKDIEANLQNSSDTFANKWNDVRQILTNTEQKRIDYLHTFFDKTDDSGKKVSISSQLDDANNDFHMLTEEFFTFQNNQKKVVTTCNTIKEKVHTMYDVFINLRPVINRLQHVRILQEIEVSKNEAIFTVKDLVTDMDTLILDATNALDIMQTTIEAFIMEIDEMISSFSITIADDNSKMTEVRADKVNFITSLQTLQENISAIMQNFVVFPHSFHQQCKQVDYLLNQLEEIKQEFDEMYNQLSQEIDILSQKKAECMESLGISSYEIVNDKFKNLISQFTITAHKEVAGKIGGFEVEEGFSAGDITFF